MPVSIKNITGLFQNQVFLLWILFILFINLLFLTLLSNHYHLTMIIPACTITTLIFLTVLWFFLEPIIIWGFTIIAIMYYSIFPGYSVALSAFIFVTTSVLNHIYNKRLDSLDNLDNQLLSSKKSASELAKEIFSLNMQADYLQRKISRAGIFKNTAELLCGEMNLETALNNIFKVIAQIIDKPGIIKIYLLQTDMKTLRLAAKSHAQIQDNNDSNSYDPVNKLVMEEGKSILVNDISLDTRFKTDSRSSGSIVAAPLVSGDKICGLIRIESSTANAFSQSDQKFLSYIAGISALVINNISLYEITSKMAVTDGLTGLYTHKHFMDTLNIFCGQKKRFSLIFIDIDNFKKINDTYGHGFGDQVIIKTAQIIKDSANEKDICARYGGEEFALILPDTPCCDAKERADKIRRDIESSAINIRRDKLKITISAAYGCYPHCANEAQQLLRITDGALYLAKRNGRNRIEKAL